MPACGHVVFYLSILRFLSSLAVRAARRRKVRLTAIQSGWRFLQMPYLQPRDRCIGGNGGRESLALQHFSSFGA